MELVGPICGCAEFSYTHLKSRINYIKNIGENFAILKEKAEHLKIRKESLNHEINRDTVLKEASIECKAWLNSLQLPEIDKQMNEIEAEFNKNKRCISGWCPNIWSRFKLGKRIVTTTQKIVKMIEASEFKGGVVVDAPPRRVEPIPTPVIHGNTSTYRTIQQILGWIHDENIQKIGVWGMGGVGKTTVMGALNNLPEICQNFQIVILVTVSKDWSLGNVQKEIVERLPLKFENNETNKRVASILSQKLETMKYLLLLDDVWDNFNFDLETIGIPIPTKENGSKIVITTRSLLVCKKMLTNKDIEVETLTSQEALDLFHNNVGGVMDNPSIQPLATDIVKECDGLPLAIIVIARSLRNEKDAHIWRNTLRELQRATFETDGMEESLFMRLKISYDRLKNDCMRNCFLYCSLYPEDFEIDAIELIEHWWAEGLMDGVQNLGEAYDKGHAILTGLTNASLLKRTEKYGNLAFQMHDVIRDLALRITSPNKGEDTVCKFLVRAHVGLKEPPNEEEWRQMQRISLMHNELRRVPESPECTLLSTLMLQENEELETIPECFFVQMPKLRVLNLSNTRIRRLPIQVGHLKRLEMLHLENSNWGGGGIEYLPSEVGQLTRLRSLRLTFVSIAESYTPNMVMIPNGVIERLSLLEDLRINVVEDAYEFGNVKLCTNQVASVTGEVAGLKCLNHLKFPFALNEDLEHFVETSYPWKDKQLKWFEFSVGEGDIDGYFGHHREVGYLKLDAENYVPSISVINNVLDRCSGFVLQHHRSIRKLSDVVGGNMDSMQRLIRCSIRECNAIESLVDVNDSSSSLTPPHVILPNLQVLHLRYLPRLRTIWKGHQSITCCLLRELTLSVCHKLTNVFSRGMAQQLSKLEQLKIWECVRIEEIVNEEEEEEEEEGRGEIVIVKRDDEAAAPIPPFPSLKSLILGELPNLVNICKGISNPMDWPSLKGICISGRCPNLKKFPLSIHNAPALTEIIGNRLEWWESLEWEDDGITKQQLPRLYA